MFVHRIAKLRYAQDLSGTGAKQFGGRWNKQGTAVVYAAETKSLALLEVLVHLGLTIASEDLVLVTIEIPPTAVGEQLHEKQLPKNWREYPAPASLAQLGDEWIRSKRTLFLQVPSVIMPSEQIVLLNPNHDDFKSVRVVQTRSFAVDKRLLSLRIGEQ